MKIGELVGFHQENFYEGAVQLRWLTQRPEQAEQAASAFVFHGPRYHAAADALSDGVDGGFSLKDSASFVLDLITSIQNGIDGKDENPYWLVVAGYGAGKSHLALTCGSLLSAPHANSTHQVLANINKADVQVGAAVTHALKAMTRPTLILALDGMSGFHLGNALTEASLIQLQRHGVDTGAIRALSPRFQLAENFVERNFSFRVQQFTKNLPNLEMAEICAQLRNNNENIYSAVDQIYSEANGAPIPVTGQESAQDLLNTLCEVYCGPEGEFSSVVILFDEFGRYLEYAAEKPLLAGDAALQQIFQGVQDNNNKIRFIGFIQYELKTYLKRFGSAGLRQLQRYITRFDSARKWYLSTNLETLFAHMISKQQPLLETAWEQTQAKQKSETLRELMQAMLPGFSRFPVWSDAEKFSRVIAQGCWPLHPIATWFLTRQRDVIQSRSALTFIKEMIERVACEPAIVKDQLRQVSVAELVLHSMLPEMIAAERETGGVVAETLQLLLTKFQSHLNTEQALALAGVAILERMRVGKQNQQQIKRMLAEVCVLTEQKMEGALDSLSQDLGAIEWNRDLGQYELIADASTRGQFQQWLRQQQSKLNADMIRDLFIRRGAINAGLDTLLPTPDFAQNKNISTQDWQYKPHYAHKLNIEKVIARAFQDWQQAYLPTDAKGQVIYLYIHAEDDTSPLDASIQAALTRGLENNKVIAAPIWIIGLNDTSTLLADHIGRLYLFEECISESDLERFRRFLPDEKERSELALKETVHELIKLRQFWVAGTIDISVGRLKTVGESIFNVVYPGAVPFQVDGFATATGSGPRDCAQLTRSLISSQVNAAWITSQPRQMQNRVTSLLVQSWRSLLNSGQLIEPSNEQARKAYEFIFKLHQECLTQTLRASFQILISPPFGMNAASAGVMLGILLGLETPPRRIEYQGKLLASGDWLGKVFPAQKGRNFLDSEVLENTTLRFLSADAIGRWKILLNKWENETHYEAFIKLANEASQTRKIEPLPEQLEGRFFVLEERTKDISAKLQTAWQELARIEKEIERGEKQGNVGSLLKAGLSLTRNLSNFTQQDCWPGQILNDCEKLIEILKELVTPQIDAWVSNQVCNSMAKVEEFRTRMGKASTSLTALSFTAQAKRLEQQMIDNIATVEIRQQFSMILDQSLEYPEQPAPSDSITVRQLRDEITLGDSLINGIRKANKALKPDEINNRISAIEQRQNLLREKIKKHTNALGNIYAKMPHSQTDLDVLLNKIRHLHTILIDTPDAQEAQDIILLLEHIKLDISAWTIGDSFSVERLTELLNNQVHDQVPRLLEFIDEKEIETSWDMMAIYQDLADERINSATQRSKEWMTPRLALLKDLNQLEQSRCISLERELSATPPFLSDEDQTIILNILDQIILRREHLEEIKRKKLVTDWINPLINLNDASNLSRHETNQWLNTLRNPPLEATPDELKCLQPIEILLTLHLDQMSIEEIIARIERLPRKIQAELLVILNNRLNIG